MASDSSALGGDRLANIDRRNCRYRGCQRLRLGHKKFNSEGPLSIPGIAGQLECLGISLCVIVVAALVAGLLPAWSLSRVTLAPALQGESGRAGTGGPLRHRIQTGLVTAQVALTCVLLVSAGLLIRSFYATQTVELGFKPDHLFKAGVTLTSVKYESDDAKIVAFWDELVTKIRQIPGVTDAAMNENPPLSGDRWSISPFS